MPASRLPRVLGALIVVTMVASCSALIPNQGLEPGWRRLIIPVTNDGPRPATLVVADSTSVTVRPVGRVSPGTVPPLSTTDVSVDVPPGRSWMIVVNPGPDNGGLIMANDLPLSVAGRLPLKIHIGSTPGTQGGSVSVPDLPGWFGN